MGLRSPRWWMVHRRRATGFAVCLTLEGVAAAAGVGGCSLLPTGREAHFQARAAVIPFRPGSGLARVMVWPASADGMLAERDGARLPRVADAGGEP